MFVKATALDGLKEGFKVVVFLDAIRAVSSKSRETALKEMEEHGIEFITSDSWEAN